MIMQRALCGGFVIRYSTDSLFAFMVVLFQLAQCGRWWWYSIRKMLFFIPSMLWFVCTSAVKKSILHLLMQDGG